MLYVTLYENRSNYLIIFILRCARNYGHGGLSDIIARIGGDEFAVLGIVAQKSDIGASESRLQEQVDIHNAGENRDYTISLSVGIACSDPENHYSIDELMSRADKLMYEQKRSKLP